MCCSFRFLVHKFVDERSTSDVADCYVFVNVFFNGLGGVILRQKRLSAQPDLLCGQSLWDSGLSAGVQRAPGGVQVLLFYVEQILIEQGLILPIGAGVGPAAGGDGAGAGAVDGFELVADALT